MALQIPEYLQTKLYSAMRDRQLLLDSVVQQGIVNVGDMVVSQRASSANMSVDISAGSAFVKGTTSARQGMYHAYNDAPFNATIAANASGNPRIDTVILRIYDSIDGAAAQDVAAFEVLTGTATAGATLANLNGAKKDAASGVPVSSLILGFVAVASGAASIVNSNIGGFITPRTIANGAITGAPAAYALGRPLGYTPLVRSYVLSQSIGNNVNVIAAMNAEDFDTDAMHDTVTNNSRLVAKTPGYYLLNYHADFTAAAGTTSRAIWLQKNGLAQRYGQAEAHTSTAANSISICGAAMLLLGYGDYAEAVVFQNSGAAMNALIDANALWMSPA